ncbi:MAG: erv26 super protein [Sclerophora amabilis]|nr:MAG: erv26 super protein [Sclerophora amabilis]
MPPRPSNTADPRYTDLHLPTFTQIASYFGICIWLVPFALFISLSAGDYVLPSMGSEYATGGGAAAVGAGGGEGSLGGGGMGRVGQTPKKKGLAKAAVDGVRDWVGESGEVMGFWTGDRTKRW